MIQVKVFPIGSRPLDETLNKFLRTHEISSVKISPRQAYDETDVAIVTYFIKAEFIEDPQDELSYS
jgi:hypothetical protein